MNSWELYKIMFYALDAVWDETKDEELGNYLSEMNPFLFKDEGSADPAYYSDFKKQFEAEFTNSCSIEEGYEFCKKFIEELNIAAVVDAFGKKTLEDWIHAYGSQN